MASQGFNIDDILGRHGYTDESISEGLAKWHGRVFRSLGTSDPAVKFGGTVPLNLLSYADQVKYMGEYREIIGLNTVLNVLGSQGQGTMAENIISQMSGGKILAENNPFGRLNSNRSGSLASRIYSNMNLQIRDSPTEVKAGVSREAFGPEHRFQIGSIPRLHTLDRPSINNAALNGSRVMVFDIETAGFRPGGIREIAYQTMRYGDPGSMARGHVTMRPSQGARGRMVTGRSAMPVDEFISREFNSPIGGAMPSNSGNDFLAKVLPWIDEARGMDYIVGHNIESFDIPQIFQGIAGTSRYRTDEAFRTHIDESFGLINSKIVDTLSMARNAPNLAGLQSATLRGDSIYSIENLLLKTDLAERIGYENLSSAMGFNGSIFTKGLHHGEVDALITSALLDNLSSLQQKDLGAGASGQQKVIADAIRAQINKSAAITPFTNIRDPSNIHRRVKQIMGMEHPDITPIGQDILLSRRIGFGGSEEDAILPARKLLSSLGEFDRMIGRNGRAYAEMYDEGVRPSSRKFNRYRRGLKDRGIGFAGLSYEERLFGTAMSDLTSNVADARFASLARETMVSRFGMFDLGSLQYTTRSNKVTLPPQVLQHLGMLSDANNPAMFSLSIVRPTAKTPSTSINLAYKFESMDDVEKAVSLMDEMASGDIKRFSEIMGLDPDSDQAKAAFKHFKISAKNGRISDALRKTGMSGVSIAQITEAQGAKGIVSLLQAANNTRDLSDTSMLPFRLPFMNMDVNQGVIRTAGAVADIGLTTQDRINISRQTQAASRVYNPGMDAPRSGFAGLLQNARMNTTARRIDKAVMSGEVDRTVKSFLFIDKELLPRAPKAVAGLAIAGVAAYMLGRKREMDKYDVSFESAGDWETGQSKYEVYNILNERMEQGYNGYYRQVDPLATASLTDNLYQGAIGHTSTRWDRNSTIYGGVL